MRNMLNVKKTRDKMFALLNKEEKLMFLFIINLTFPLYFLKQSMMLNDEL